MWAVKQEERERGAGVLVYVSVGIAWEGCVAVAEVRTAEVVRLLGCRREADDCIRDTITCLHQHRCAIRHYDGGGPPTFGEARIQRVCNAVFTRNLVIVVRRLDSDADE